MFCEILGLQNSSVKDVMDMVASMNTIFSCFDELMDEYKVYKVNISNVNLKTNVLRVCKCRLRLWARFTCRHVVLQNALNATPSRSLMWRWQCWTRWRSCSSPTVLRRIYALVCSRHSWLYYSVIVWTMNTFFAQHSHLARTINLIEIEIARMQFKVNN